VKKILVIGATGPQGRPVAEQLLDAGFAVRALVRDPGKAGDLAARGAEIATGDLDDPESLARAIAGQDGIFLLLSFFTGTARQGEAVVAAAQAAGVRQIVWNATGQILPFDTGNPAVDLRRPVLEALDASGIAYTALQPTVYMENLLIPALRAELAASGTLPYPMPESVRCQWISHQDAAGYAVAAFRRGPVDRRAIEISGPERLTGPEIAERLTRALGRAVRFRPMPPKEFARVVDFGGNEAAVEQFYDQVFAQPELMSTNVDHDATLAILPITPLSFEAWARRYREVLIG
jgi:uncharacterized protein YbjT (DUF2867 family)